MALLIFSLLSKCSVLTPVRTLCFAEETSNFNPLPLEWQRYSNPCRVAYATRPTLFLLFGQGRALSLLNINLLRLEKINILSFFVD